LKYLQNMKTMNAVINSNLAQSNTPQSICFPEHITVTTTLRCNYRCVMCYQKSYEGELDWSIYKKLEDILPFARGFQIFGGEPMLYPRIHDLYKLAHKYQNRIDIISNGSLLTDETCESIVANQVGHIKFSIDAGTQKTYKKIRGGNFFKVMAGIAKISQLKAKYGSPFPSMELNFLAMRSNVSELPKLVTMAKEVGATQINVFYPGMSTKDMVDECVWFCQEYSDSWLAKSKMIADSIDMKLRLPPLFSECTDMEASGTRPFCADPWTKLLVDVDGTATLCCGGPTKIGNLLEQDFDEIWNSKAARKLRAVVNTPDEPAYCKNCRVRKPNPAELKLHIGSKPLQEYALKKYGMEQEADSLPPSRQPTQCERSANL